MRKSEQNARLYQRATRKEIERKTKKNKCVIIYDAASSSLEMKTGPMSAGEDIHRQLSLKCNCNLSWHTFGGYLNGCATGKQFERLLQEADVLYVDFSKRPENEPTRGAGAKAIISHLEKARHENPKIKVFLKEGSNKHIKISGAFYIENIKEIF